MAGTAESMAANQAALAQAAANIRIVMQAGAEGAALAAPQVGEETVAEVKDLIGIQGPPRSAPGEPPHIDTGALIDSYDYNVEGDAGTIILEVGSTVEYAPYLEFGTSRMDARPHLRPALENMMVGGRITQIVRYSVAQAQSAAIAAMGGQP
jgi:HK97 gp10 family phage protein